MNAKRIMRMREGGHVQRCHCMPHHGTYDVAQHTFHMLILMEELHPNPSRELYSLILRHDLMERWTGDSPATAKRWMPGLKIALTGAEEELEKRTGIEAYLGDHVTESDRRWLKALDQVEFILWCEDQIALGNLNVLWNRAEMDRWIERDADSIPAPVLEFLESFEWKRTPDDLS